MRDGLKARFKFKAKADAAADAEATTQLPGLTSRVLAVIVGIGVGLLGIVLGTLVPIAVLGRPETAQLWVEIVTRSLAVLAGVGGGFAVWLAFRRQQHTEDTARRDYAQRESFAEHARTDALERRITEQRIEAVAQLGSDRAPVRIGGLHNLELLGERYPDLRQVVINELCAYLRMPYTPVVRASVSHRLRTDDAVDYTAGSVDVAALQEREVRRTAQRILARHFRHGPEDPKYWEHDSVYLTETVLEDFNFHKCVLHNARFTGTVFAGDTSFDKAEFHGEAAFDAVEFHGMARFTKAEFTDEAHFFESRFAQLAHFQEAVFQEGAGFKNAVFEGKAIFAKVRNPKLDDRGKKAKPSVRFEGARFAGKAVFSDAEFGESVNFKSARFHRITTFKGIRFKQDADFQAAVFTDPVRFTDAEFGGPVTFDRVVFGRRAEFESAEFGGELGIEETAFGGPASFAKCVFAQALDIGPASFGAEVSFAEADFKARLIVAKTAISGAADFTQATFHDGVRFLEKDEAQWDPSTQLTGATAVLDPHMPHLWPPGWQFAPNSDKPKYGRLEYRRE